MNLPTAVNLIGGIIIGYYVTKHYFVAGKMA